MRLEDLPRADRLPGRFWPKVEKCGDRECWPWRGSRTPDGRGQFSVGRRPYGAHRVAWLLERGELADEAAVVHTCPEPSCVNPAHLRLVCPGERRPRGSGRSRRGEGNARAKLTAVAVVDIRARAAGGEPLTRLAREYDVGPGAVSAAVQGRTWRHLPLGQPPPQRGLTEERVGELRARLASGEARADLAREYGVSESAVSRAASGETWRGAPGDGEVPPGRLTPERVREVRRAVASGGETQREIARRLGISDTTVSRIALGRIWRDV